MITCLRGCEGGRAECKLASWIGRLQFVRGLPANVIPDDERHVPRLPSKNFKVFHFLSRTSSRCQEVYFRRHSSASGGTLGQLQGAVCPRRDCTLSSLRQYILYLIT